MRMEILENGIRGRPIFENLSEQIACAAPGSCRQNVVATLNGVIFFLFLSPRA
jgi:hypothetical protein